MNCLYLENVLGAHHEAVAAVVVVGVFGVVDRGLDVNAADLDRLVGVPVQADVVHLAFDVIDLGKLAVVVFSAQVVVAVEQLPGTDLLVRRLDRIELAELVATRLASQGVGSLYVVAVGIDILVTVIVGLHAARHVLTLQGERAHGQAASRPQAASSP